MHPLRILLEQSIDYAGLFPPAGLDMRPAAENDAAYRSSPHAWALGRFVVPAARLEELEAASADLLPAQPTASPWHLSVLLGADPAAEVRALGEFNCRHAATGAGALLSDVELGRPRPAGGGARGPCRATSRPTDPCDRDRPTRCRRRSARPLARCAPAA
jgi:hypothetical protein